MFKVVCTVKNTTPTPLDSIAKVDEVIIVMAQESELKNIVEIYNWAIKNTSATFDTEEKSVSSQLNWFNSHDKEFPIVVAKKSDRVIAFGSISKWSDRCAYSGTGEISFYVHPSFHGPGFGAKILEKILEIGRKNNFRTLVSRIEGKSEVSIHLHSKFCFSDIGTMKSVGKKFDEIIDVHLMQILF